MEPKLVYRFLRQVSDWVLDNYYSECVVEGQENVPLHGPIIIASTHQNEMVDIAALAATLPHRRHLAFWAKASMFKNPIGRAIMTSSGAIPVRRNPNAVGGTSTLSTEEELAARASLFRETTSVLRKDGVIGIFPEGTSCTGWRVFQTMPGAAWAAVEYTRAMKGIDDAPELRIIPVAITYTDKTKYRSRVHVRYGKPIRMDDMTAELFEGGTDPNVAAKSVVGKLTTEIESSLIRLTVNASDWETICASQTASQILWTNDSAPLTHWVDFHQRFVASLDDPVNTDASTTKAALCKYHALLHHTGIEHTTLSSLVPLNAEKIFAPSTRSILSGLPLAIIRFSLFLPALAFALPGYVLGPLAKRVLSKPDEDEGHSQFKAIAGGLGIGGSILGLFKLLSQVQKVEVYGSNFWAAHRSGRLAQILGATYVSAWVLLRWHNLLVKANYNELKRIQTYWKLLRYSFASNTRSLSETQLEPYTKLPHPAVNPFIKSKYLANLPARPPLPPKVPAVSLMRHLLLARKDAARSLASHISEARHVMSALEIGNMGGDIPTL